MFHQSEAYKNLKTYFDDRRLNLSNFAMVTKLHNGTLKQLLEDPYHDPMAKTMSEPQKLKNSLPTGYEILRGLDFEERIKTIKPILDDLAAGLLLLHRAKRYHLDLKPANIYYTVYPTRFEVLLGDLGFIGHAQALSPGSMKTSYEEDIPLGTLHFRSPEQKDFFDICETHVLPVNGTSHHGDGRVLIIRDPKFANTIIEPGDYLVFMTDAQKKPHIIIDIEPEHDNNGINFERKIIIVNDKTIVEDERTLIKIYKRQGVRTDLFGFGAILFDLITCGYSPERFYSDLIANDKEDLSISDILKKYEQVKAFRIKDNTYINVFKPFQHTIDRTFAPIEIVEIILKCMMYKAKGTFYKESIKRGEEKDTWRAMQSVHNEIIKLEQINKHYGIRAIDENSSNVLKTNALFSKTSKPQTRDENADFSLDIKRIQNLRTNDLPYRMGRAFIRLDQIVEFIRYQILSDARGRKLYFAELAPENIQIVNNELQLLRNSYEKLDDLKADMISNTAFSQISYDDSDPFSPLDVVRNFHRPIKLDFSNLEPDASAPTAAQDKSNDSYLCRYEFTNASPLGDDIQEGDWIVINSSLNKLARVESATNNLLKIKPEGNWELDDQDMKAINYNYYQELDRNRYFARVIGTYIYQLFFVGIQGNTISGPHSIRGLVNNLLSKPSIESDLYAVIKKSLSINLNKKFSNEKIMINRIYRYLIALYLLLILPNFIDDVRKEKEGDQDEIKFIELLMSDYIEKLKSGISNCLRITKPKLNKESYSEWLQNKNGDTRISLAIDMKQKDDQDLKLNLSNNLSEILSNKPEMLNWYLSSPLSNWRQRSRNNSGNETPISDASV